MRAKTYCMVGGGILLIMTCLMAINAARHRREAEASLSALAAKRAALDADLGRMKSRSVAAESTRIELTRALNSLGPPNPPANAAAARKPDAKPEQPRTMSEIIANDPKAEVLMLRWQRAVVLLEYGPFFRAQGLSPEQIRKFQDNWVKRSERDIDLRAAVRAQDDIGKQIVAKLQEQAKSEYEAAELEVLGADACRHLQEYNRTVVARNVVVLGVAAAAALEGIPITAQQGDQLWQAAINAASRDINLQGEKLVATIDWDALDAQARQILSPAQFVLFKTVAPPSGFQGRGKYELDAAIRRAQQADAANFATPASKPPGG